MQCVILAGGLGSRLWPVTKTIPKALMPINGRPFADYQLAWLRRQEITDVVYCLGFLGDQVRSHVGDGSAFGLKIHYTDEGSNLRGTAGALRLALDVGLLAETFFVLYGDSFLPIEFAPVLATYQASGYPALMTVIRNEDKWDHSNVIFTPPKINLYDGDCNKTKSPRMIYIDYGLSVLSRRLIATRVKSQSATDLADLFKQLSLAGELAGFEVFERFYEVGSTGGIADFTRYVTETGLQTVWLRMPRPC